MAQTGSWQGLNAIAWFSRGHGPLPQATRRRNDRDFRFPVTAFLALGNIAGGAGGVALVYWAIYLRGRD